MEGYNYEPCFCQLPLDSNLFSSKKLTEPIFPASSFSFSLRFSVNFQRFSSHIPWYLGCLPQRPPNLQIPPLLLLNLVALVLVALFIQSGIKKPGFKIIIFSLLLAAEKSFCKWSGLMVTENLHSIASAPEVNAHIESEKQEARRQIKRLRSGAASWLDVNLPFCFSCTSAART